MSTRTSTEPTTPSPGATLPRGPRYTISGDFHYCVVEAESSSEPRTFEVAVATADSPGAEPGEDWRGRHREHLWIVPEAVDPFAFALGLLNCWYEQSTRCPACGDAACIDFDPCWDSRPDRRPYRVATPAGRAYEWRVLAARWALARWGWDDCEDDLTLRGRDASARGEAPDAFIDAMAEHWDLLEDTMPSPQALAARRRLAAVIEAFMAEGGAQ